MERHVKLGRKWVDGAAFVHHWAVKVGDTWYELGLSSKSAKSSECVTITCARQKVAPSGAGEFGGETVGKTTKTDYQIKSFNIGWCRENPKYEFTSTNCQKYALDFIHWLTEGNYRVIHQPDAASTDSETDRLDVGNSIAIENDGQAFASASAVDLNVSTRVGTVKGSLLSVEAEAIAGPGLGAWANASLADAEISAGPLGVRGGLNVNTGVGVRGGNLDVHLLGFGVKVGADGLAVDTPVVGAKCTVM